VRSLDSPSVRLVPGTELASGPPPIFFWSADSRYIAYFAEGRLKKVPAAGGPAEVICTLPPALNYTGTWSQRGVILFGAATREGTTLWRVPAAGGQPVPLHDANASKPEQAFFPIFLPDGRHYLAMAPTGNGQTAEAFVGELDSTDRRRLPESRRRRGTPRPGTCFSPAQGRSSHSLSISVIWSSRESHV
jgi:hypothetical protein